MALFFSTLRHQTLSVLSLLALVALPVMSHLSGKGDVFTESVLAFAAVSASLGLIIQREFERLYKSVTGMTPNEVALEALKEAKKALEGESHGA